MTDKEIEEKFLEICDKHPKLFLLLLVYRVNPKLTEKLLKEILKGAEMTDDRYSVDDSDKQFAERFKSVDGGA